MTSPAKNSGKRGIRRYSYDGIEGWQVRYMRDGALFQQIFRDKAYGGEAAALTVAEEFHTRLLSYFPPITRREWAEMRRANSREVVGVSRVVKKVKGHEYPAWEARWTQEPGKHRNKRFYVGMYGEEEAKRLAIEVRKAAVAALGDGFLAGYDGDLVWIVPPDEIAIAANVDTEGDSEGAIALREHRLRERSRELREAKIRAFIEEHGSVFCELCGFDFERFYGALGSGLIEVHHTKAIADYEKEAVTELSDLILVCSNCHYVIHRDKHYERNHRQLMQVVALKKTAKLEKKPNQSLKTTTMAVASDPKP